MYYIGAGEGLRPFEPPTGEGSPLAPPSPPPLPSPFPMTEASIPREATGKLSTTTARAPLPLQLVNGRALECKRIRLETVAQCKEMHQGKKVGTDNVPSLD